MTGQPKVIWKLWKYDLPQIVKLLKKQGFYRRKKKGEKLSEEAEKAPFEKYSYPKTEL